MRIGEPCPAAGGPGTGLPDANRPFASKSLLERLSPQEATALLIDPDDVRYTPVADLSTATEKARRDAPAIAVCEL